MPIVEATFDPNLVSPSGWGPQLTGTVFHRVYAIKFVSGRIKVGQTQNPRTRWACLMTDTRKVGDSVAKVWFSRGHINARANEVLLIKFCGERWAATEGKREYFVEGDFKEVLDFAEGLELVRLHESHLTAHQQMVERHIDRFTLGLQTGSAGSATPRTALNAEES